MESAPGEGLLNFFQEAADRDRHGAYTARIADESRLF